MERMMSHEHEWVVWHVASQTLKVSPPESVSDDQDELVVQAKVLCRCTVEGCPAARTEVYEGPPEGVPKPPVPEDIQALHEQTTDPGSKVQA